MKVDVIAFPWCFYYLPLMAIFYSFLACSESGRWRGISTQDSCGCGLYDMGFPHLLSAVKNGWTKQNPWLGFPICTLRCTHH